MALTQSISILLSPFKYKVKHVFCASCNKLVLITTGTRHKQNRWQLIWPLTFDVTWPLMASKHLCVGLHLSTWWCTFSFAKLIHSYHFIQLFKSSKLYVFHQFDWLLLTSLTLDLCDVTGKLHGISRKMAVAQPRSEARLSMEIRTKSVEQTLIPLVTQVRIIFMYSVWYSYTAS